MSKQVVAVIGAGGMGESIARRQGAGKILVLTDFNGRLLNIKVEALRSDGFDIRGLTVDVSSRASVHELAAAISALGLATQVIHTAGILPTQAPIGAILAVDLIGVALVLEEFGSVIADGGAGVVIASMAGSTCPGLTPEQEYALATVGADDLLQLPFTSGDAVPDPDAAYGIAKRANQLRVRHASQAWGARGGRVNSVSTGVISTAMGQQELDSEFGLYTRAVIDVSGTRRIGTPHGHRQRGGLPSEPGSVVRLRDGRPRRRRRHRRRDDQPAVDADRRDQRAPVTRNDAAPHDHANKEKNR